MIDFSKISSGIKRKGKIWYSENIPKVSYLEKGNELFYHIEDDSFWFNHRNKVIEIILGNYDPGEFILDVGGGNGYVTKYLQDSGYESVLVEPGYDGIINAEKRGVKNIINSTLENINFEKGSVSSVGIFDVLEHVNEENKFLSEINYILKKGGRLYITVPAYNLLWSSEDRIAGHYRRYSIKSINNVLKENGFEVEYESFFFSILVVPIFIFRSIPSLFLKLFKISKSEPNLNAHSSKRSFSDRILNLFLKPELIRFMKRKKLWFGSSLIIIAKKQ